MAGGMFAPGFSSMNMEPRKNPTASAATTAPRSSPLLNMRPFSAMLILSSARFAAAFQAYTFRYPRVRAEAYSTALNK